MRVLHIANIGRSGKLGGIGVAVMQLSKAQRELGVDSRICTTKYNEIYVDNNLTYYTDSTEKFKQLIDGFRPDIITINGLYEKEEIPYTLYIWKKQIPYIIVYHGSASHDNVKKGWLKKKIANYIFFDRIIKRASFVVYLNVNEYNKSVFQKINKRYYIIPNGVIVPSDVPMSSTQKRVNITFMSRLDYHGKGLDVLLPAIKKLREEGWEDKIVFTFYGNHYDDTYKKFLEFGDFLQYKGFVSGWEKSQALIDSSIIILPSRSEGMPIIILEALAFGRPCMVTSMTNMAELIEGNNCGWVIELSEESIIEKIKQAYQQLHINPSFYFDNCRQVAKEYSWYNVAKRTIEVYNTVI